MSPLHLCGLAVDLFLSAALLFLPLLGCGAGRATAAHVARRVVARTVVPVVVRVLVGHPVARVCQGLSPQVRPAVVVLALALFCSRLRRIAVLLRDLVGLDLALLDELEVLEDGLLVFVDVFAQLLLGVEDLFALALDLERPVVVFLDLQVQHVELVLLLPSDARDVELLVLADQELPELLLQDLVFVPLASDGAALALFADLFGESVDALGAQRLGPREVLSAVQLPLELRERRVPLPLS